MDKLGGFSKQKSRMVNTVNLYFYFQTCLYFRCKMMVSEQTNKAQVSKSSTVYKPFSCFFIASLPSGSWTKNGNTQRPRSSVCPSEHLLPVCTAGDKQVFSIRSPGRCVSTCEEGGAERKQNRPPNSVLLERCWK